jgi:CheY-like chemotaxis protein
MLFGDYFIRGGVKTIIMIYPDLGSEVCMQRVRTSCALQKRDYANNKQTIMLVDDDPIFRRFTAAVLQSEGYTVIEAEHGLDGLEKLRQSVPDLIISDICMPILDGIEFAEEVSWEYASIPMIVVSATNDVSDVARALRFGIKDFLTKPITDPQHLLSAIGTILLDEQQHPSDSRDFASQWFRVGEQGEIPEDKELHWHLQYLRENQGAARDLLSALLPDRDTQHGVWRCSYNLLQAAESLPLLFDYAWLSNGQFAFYLVDATSEDGGGIASALLIRALFNDYLRQHELSPTSLEAFAARLEKGVTCLEGASPVRALFGLADMVDEQATLLPAGLEAIWSASDGKYHVEAGQCLGEGCQTNQEIKALSLASGGKLNIANIGVSYFGLEISMSS